ncbi:YCF48-related protein [Ferruginibacter sp. SUN106]|uniref:YCF48-related protein n=1 Tax=Ferruginibacter sp. SUN106 TaxID=2978348 RepID=UPI003D362900
MAKRSLKTKFSSLAVIILMITGLNVKAQLNPAVGAGPWKYVVPFQHGFNLTDMSFIDNKTGLAVGNNGAIARTTDSGRNWQYIPFKFINASNTLALAQFSDVQFVTPTIAYAVGGSGLMIKSTDGGLNWAQVTTPLTALSRNINALHFLNKDTGYIGGAAINTTNTTNINDAPKVYFTRNGGTTWDSLASPFRPQQNNITLSGFNSAEIQRIMFVNDSVGYVSGSCGQSVPNYSAILWKIEKNIVKDYSLHRTKFGVSITTGTGSNPTQCTQTYKGLLGINDSLVLISSNSNGIVVRVRTGKNDSTANAVPLIYGAYERGVYEVVAISNTFPTTPPNSPLNTGAMWHIRKAPGGKIVMSDGRSIAFSTDNGTNWTATNPVPASSNIAHWGYQAMDITPNGRIVAAGYNGMTYDSLPGAAGWSTVYKNIRPLFYSYSDMDWADNCNGIIVGASGTIAKTSDGGKNWVDASNAVFDANQISLTNVFYPAVNSMFFSTNTFGFIGIHKSADQGQTYTPIFIEPNQNTGGITNFTMVGNRAWAVGYRFSPEVQRTVIFRSLNVNAATPVWDTTKTFPIGTFAPQLKNIKFANQDTGYTCGNRGKVYRTVNGGTTWTDVSPDTTAAGNATATYNALSVIDGKTLYVGGSSKKLFRSTDAGATWTDLTLVQTTNPITISAFTSISTIIMNDVNNGYINAGSLLLTTTNGWSTWTYDLSPQGMSNISIYPKMVAPIQNKKLYAMPLVAGFGGPISTSSAILLEYGNTAFTTVNSSEVVTNATCTNPNGGSVTINTTGGIAPYTYTLNGSALQSSNVFTGLTQGVKTIVIRDAACQVFTKTVTIGFTDNLTLTTSNDTAVCAGAPVPMIATSAANVYSWSPAGGLSNSTISNPVATVNSNTTYTVTATLNGCVRTKAINISTKANPVISAGPDKTIISGDVVTLDGSSPNTNVTSILWSPATTITSGANSYVATAQPTATTTYTLTVKDNNSCTSTDNTVITVIPYCIKIMDAFTPNGDGINDKWIVTSGGACTSQVMVNVFNRNGDLVYSNENYQNDWNGTYKGKALPDATYYYVIRFKLITGNGLQLKGDVTILR